MENVFSEPKRTFYKAIFGPKFSDYILYIFKEWGLYLLIIVALVFFLTEYIAMKKEE